MQALGGILNVRWVQMGAVTFGPYCAARGIVQAIGQLGEALITIVGPLLYCYLERMTHILPDTRCPHIRNRSVASRYSSTRVCFWTGWARLCFHCSLDWHRYRQ